MPGQVLGDGRTVRALVCDDDAVNRTVMTDLLEARGAQVIAETGRAGDAITLIERFGPDLVLCDMALEAGTGMDVVEHIARTAAPCRVIVFTAFAEMPRAVDGVSMKTVIKPDFDGLERAIDDAVAAGAPSSSNRRRPTRASVPPAMRGQTGLDDPAEFYRELSDAADGDALLAVPVTDAEEHTLSQALRRAIRVQDRMIRRRDRLLVLLVGGGGAGPSSVLGRLAATHPTAAAAARSIVIDASGPAVETLLDGSLGVPSPTE